MATGVSPPPYRKESRSLFNRKRAAFGVVYHSDVDSSALLCWSCSRSLDPGLLAFDAVLLPRSASQGGPVLLLRCPECGIDNIAERNRAGEHLLIPPPLARFTNSNVRGTVAAEANRWARDNAIQRAEFLSREAREAPAMPLPEVPDEASPDEPAYEIPGPERPAPRDRGAELNSVLEAYEVMGLELTATPDEIRRRFRELSKKCHPDRVADLDDEIRRAADRRFAEVRRAYDLLIGT